MKFKISIFLGMLAFITLGSFQLKAQSLPDNIDISTSPNGIVALPSTVPAVFANNGFVKYTKIQCPNGQAIHFIAQNLISDAQIIYARTLLEFYLTNLPGSQYGADKSAVINSMGTNDAMLMLVNGTHAPGNEPNINAQGLYQNEMSVPGHTWYQTNDYNHRDAAFEEILHLMHDRGIGVDGPNSTPGALPAYQTEIRAAQNNAILNNYAIWPKGAATDLSWYNDLAQENSLSQEYLASVIDSYYGLWAPWTGSSTLGMWGEYIAKTRAEIQTEDPMGYALLPKYFSPFVNVDMVIDPSFNGVFTLTFDANNLYTHKSQYLQHVYLTGSNNAGLQGNAEYNRLKGNNGNNTLEGLKGNDRLDGQGGTNTAIFSGNYADYTVNNQGSYATVTDGVNNRDGVDTLWNIQEMKFADQTVPISLSGTVGMSEPDAAHPIQLYPNPAREVIRLNANQNQTFSEIAIYDITGQRVYVAHHYTTSTPISVAHLRSGIYFVQIHDTQTHQVIKWIKE